LTIMFNSGPIARSILVAVVNRSHLRTASFQCVVEGIDVHAEYCGGLRH
jgi:hypothetical protein